jgi:enterochelin esterase-like enzyme
MRLALALLVLLALAGCGGGGGGSASAPATGTAPGFPTRTMTAIASSQTGISYNVQISLPAGYETSTTRYPVIYAADAESRFTNLADVLERANRPIILVNIWHMGTARRFIDFTMPGAEAYYRFLALELIPMIDAQYRTDPANRAYNGHSLSGQFALYALYLEKPGQRYFRHFISEEGSFWYGPDERHFDAVTAEPAASMERQMFERDRNLPVTVVMAGDNLANGPLVNALYAQLEGRAYQGLRMTLASYSRGHVGMDAVAFADAVAFVYGP